VKKRILVIQGHPSRDQNHLGHALAAAYREGAVAAGHEARQADVALLEFPLLRDAEDWSKGTTPPALQAAQADIAWADHLVVIYPLWTGMVPAVTKAFFEQVARPGFAFNLRPNGKGLAPAWKGKSARVVVTLGMPAFFYRLVHGAIGVRAFNRDLLGMVGIKPARTTYIGSVGSKTFDGKRWLECMRALGREGR
jgi:putative NADPH-quinone reductase